MENRKIAFEKQLDDIAENLYSGIFGIGLPLKRRAELLSFRYLSKANAFVDCLSDEFAEVKKMLEGLDKSEERRLKLKQSRICNSKSVQPKRDIVGISSNL